MTYFCICFCKTVLHTSVNSNIHMVSNRLNSQTKSYIQREYCINKMISYCRETALQSAL